MLDAISVQAVHKIFCLFIFIEDFLLVETFDGQLCYSGRTKSFPIILWERKINKSAQTKIFAFWMKISHISALSFSFFFTKKAKKSIAIRSNLKLIGWILGGFTYQWENFKVVFLKSTFYFLVAFVFLTII